MTRPARGASHLPTRLRKVFRDIGNLRSRGAGREDVTRFRRARQQVFSCLCPFPFRVTRPSTEGGFVPPPVCLAHGQGLRPGPFPEVLPPPCSTPTATPGCNSSEDPGCNGEGYSTVDCPSAGGLATAGWPSGPGKPPSAAPERRPPGRTPAQALPLGLGLRLLDLRRPTGWQRHRPRVQPRQQPLAQAGSGPSPRERQ
jgi:hypothetical protein